MSTDGTDPPGSTELVLVFLAGASIKTPPVGEVGRLRIGFLLRAIQQGQAVPYPLSRPMPSVGRNCHELRVSDDRGEWRVISQVRAGRLLVGEVFSKKTNRTPKEVIRRCQKRFEAAE